MSDWEIDERHRRSAPPRAGLARMAAALGIRSEATRVRRLGGGLATATHLVAFADHPAVVIKRLPPTADSAGSEWQRLCFAHGAGAPAPLPLAADVAGDWFGCPTIVMARVPGRADLTPRNTDRYAAEVVAALGRIHTIDVTGVTDALTPTHPVDAWKPPDETPRGLLAPDLAARLLERVLAAMPLTDGRPTVFNHCDFHPGNLVWSRGRLTAAVDWSAARVGYASWDVAYFSIEAELLTGAETARKFEQRYEAEVGPTADLLAWKLLCALNVHKWARHILIGWHEQGRRDLTIETVTRRLTALTQRLLTME